MIKIDSDGSWYKNLKLTSKVEVWVVISYEFENHTGTERLYWRVIGVFDHYEGEGGALEAAENKHYIVGPIEPNKSRKEDWPLTSFIGAGVRHDQN